MPDRINVEGKDFEPFATYTAELHCNAEVTEDGVPLPLGLALSP